MSFVKKSARKEQSFDVISTVGAMVRMRPQEGEVGIEIEVEGKRIPKEGLPSIWGYHIDNSLRGGDNGEYVLKKPIPFLSVETVLDNLWKVFEKEKTEIDDSNRTSVHIHVNVQNFFLNRLTVLLSLYFVFEELFTEWCGEHRVGNLFCMRVKDAPGIIRQLRTFIQTDMQSGLSEHLRYAGINACSLTKFGSLEFRSLRGTPEKEIILQWVRVIERLYRISADYSDPREICYMFSSSGPLQYFDDILGEEGYRLKNAVGWTNERLRNSMYEGIRYAQDLCFCRDWSAFSPITLKSDPFGRDTRKLVPKMMAISQEEEPELTVLNPVYDDPEYGYEGPPDIDMEMENEGYNE